MKQKKKRGLLIVAIILALVLILAVIWIILRRSATIQCTEFKNTANKSYSESEKVFAAMSYSYFVHGCEECSDLSGTVGDILDTKKPKYVEGNADIIRRVDDDPKTSTIDTEDFIKREAGSHRFLIDLRDERSGFYGAAFSDDENKVVWISYSGVISVSDFVQFLLLMVGPGFSRQEEKAFELYENVLKTPEIQNGYDLILTGYSLGGSLATMVSYMSGAEAITISGGDGIAMSKIKSIVPTMRKDNYRITDYATSPKDFPFSLKNLAQHVMYWGDYSGITRRIYRSNGLTDNAHSIFGFVRFEDGDQKKPILPPENE